MCGSVVYKPVPPPPDHAAVSTASAPRDKASVQRASDLEDEKLKIDEHLSVASKMLWFKLDI